MESEVATDAGVSWKEAGGARQRAEPELGCTEFLQNEA